MKRTVLAPVTVLLGLLGSMVVMAKSNFFTPIVQFVHTGSITPLQAVICLLFTGAGFAVCYYLLNILYSYFVPRMGETSSNSGVVPQTSPGNNRDISRDKHLHEIILSNKNEENDL